MDRTGLATSASFRAPSNARSLAADDLIGEDAFEDAGQAPEPRREGEWLEGYERQAIQAALQRAGGNRDEDAEILKIGVATLCRKLKRPDLK